MVRDYHKLEVWRRSHLLVLRVYRFSEALPADERFGLVAQMRRAAASVPANIVEGTGRPTHSDFARFLGIAAASLNEMQYHLELARDLELGDPSENAGIRREAAEVRAMITRLRSKVSSGPGSADG